jgi:hypothetical protein
MGKHNCCQCQLRTPHDQPLTVAGRANRAETLTAEVQDPRSVPHDRGAKSARRSSLSFHFNIIIPFAHTSLLWSLSFRFPHQNPECPRLPPPYVSHTSSISFSLI